MEATRKQIWRNARSECLRQGLHKLIATLVLLGAHWECMAALLTLKKGKLKRARLAKESMTTDKLQEMAILGFQNNPWLADIVDNVEHAFHSRAKNKYGSSGALHSGSKYKTLKASAFQAPWCRSTIKTCGDVALMVCT